MTYWKGLARNVIPMKKPLEERPVDALMTSEGYIRRQVCSLHSSEIHLQQPSNTSWFGECAWMSEHFLAPITHLHSYNISTPTYHHRMRFLLSVAALLAVCLVQSQAVPFGNRLIFIAPIKMITTLIKK